MLLTIFIILQIIALAAFAATFLTKTPITSALSMVTSAILMLGAWVIRTGLTYVWNPAIRAYVSTPVYLEIPYLAGFNILLFSLSLMFFLHDIITFTKDEVKQIDRNMKSSIGGV